MHEHAHARRKQRVVVGAMLVLTFATGVIDAVGFLGLDRVFAGNMTGNVAILGMGLAGADDLPVLGPGVALGAFMLGATVAGRVLRHAPPGVRWTGHYTCLLAGVVVLLAGTALIAVLDDPDLAIELSTTAGLATAMGMQAGTARHIAVKDVTTVVVTSTLTGLAADSWVGSRISGQPWMRRIASVVTIAAGALAGAALLQFHLGWGIALAAALTLVVVVAAPVLLREPAAPDVGSTAASTPAALR